MFDTGKLDKLLNIVLSIVLTLDGNPENVAHAYRKIGLFGEINPICDYFRSDRMPLTDQITNIAPYLRTYF